jgi:hypothetical protein
MAVVERYRDLVYAGVVPWHAQNRFKLIDFASRGMHREAAEVVSQMVFTFPPSAASVTVVRIMAIEALRSGDSKLFADICRIFVPGNRDFSRTEWQFLAALRSPG